MDFKKLLNSKDMYIGLGVGLLLAKTVLKRWIVKR